MPTPMSMPTRPQPRARAPVLIPPSDWNEALLRLGRWYGLRLRVGFPGVRPEGLEVRVHQAFRRLQREEWRAFPVSGEGRERPLDVRWRLTPLEAGPPGCRCFLVYQLDFVLVPPPPGYVAPSFLLGPYVRLLASRLKAHVEAVEDLGVEWPGVPAEPRVPEPRPILDVDTAPLAEALVKVGLLVASAWLLAEVLRGRPRRRSRR